MVMLCTSGVTCLMCVVWVMGEFLLEGVGEGGSKLRREKVTCDGDRKGPQFRISCVRVVIFPGDVGIEVLFVGLHSQ